MSRLAMRKIPVRLGLRRRRALVHGKHPLRPLVAVVVMGVGTCLGLPLFDTPAAYSAVGEHIFVKTITGRTLTIDVGLSDITENVKEKVQHQDGIPPNHQRLIFRGRVLDDGRSLASYGIEHGSTLHLVFVLNASDARPTAPHVSDPGSRSVAIPPGTPTGVVVSGSGMADWLASVAAQFGNPSITYSQAVASAATTCSAAVETKPGNSVLWAYCALPS